LRTSHKVLLKQDPLNPGDKFIVYANDTICDENLKDLFKKTNGVYEEIDNPVLALNIVSIEDSGKISYLNSSVSNYEFDGERNKTKEKFRYHIHGKANSNSDITSDIDSYRNVLSSGYSVFKEKTSGRLAILAELIMIDSYSVTHSVEVNDGNTFKVIIHTDVTPEVTEDNINKIPKLKYYYIDRS
jgi:hypothetical protein